MPDTAVGWCWTKKYPDHKLYAVAAGYEPVLIDGVTHVTKSGSVPLL